MDGRKRTVQIKFRVTEAERDLILEKMKLVPTWNMAAYLRKIAIDGYIIQIDHSRHKGNDRRDTEDRGQRQPDSPPRERDGERIPRGHRGNKGGACGDMAVTKIKPIKSTLSKALDYIENPDKTDGKMLMSSFGCSYETADIEFEYTLSQALQKGNNLAHH